MKQLIVAVLVRLAHFFDKPQRHALRPTSTPSALLPISQGEKLAVQVLADSLPNPVGGRVVISVPMMTLTTTLPQLLASMPPTTQLSLIITGYTSRFTESDQYGPILGQLEEQLSRRYQDFTLHTHSWPSTYILITTTSTAAYLFPLEPTGSFYVLMDMSAITMLRPELVSFHQRMINDAPRKR